MSYHNTRYNEVDVRQMRAHYTMVRLVALGFVFGFFALLALALLWTPITGPWSQERQGMANLRQATQERQITVEVARGEMDAAQAKADAIRTMGQAARDFPEYRTQEFIAAFSEALAKGTIARIIYVPMEAQLPITEASRFQP